MTFFPFSVKYGSSSLLPLPGPPDSQCPGGMSSGMIQTNKPAFEWNKPINKNVFLSERRELRVVAVIEHLLYAEPDLRMWCPRFI